VLAVIQPAAIVDNTSWTTVEIDTKADGINWEYATFYFLLGATDIAIAALKMQESDTTGSGMADVTGLIFGTSDNTGGSTSTLPSATDDDLVFAFEVDLRGRKRFLDVTATAGDGSAGSYAAALCILSRGGTMPSTAAERGCSQILQV
jgi:hypothetical protein